MALNEHDPNGPSIVGELVPAPAASDDARSDQQSALTQEILTRVERAVVSGDVDAYAAVLAAVGTIDDIHRRHLARLRVVEAVLVPRPGLSPTVLSRMMLRALDALIGWLGQQAAEPTLLAYAGVLATELGIYRPAEELFEASLRLVDHPEHRASLAAARSRRQAGAKVLGLPADVSRGLARRKTPLRRIAANAKPAEGMRISLCMIVRDEEEMLGRCLAAVAPGVDEMVIVDTGSRDRTVEIAESFGAKVLFHEWTGDFSQARNIGFDAATGDWILWLDADEVFVEGDAVKLRELATRTWRECFRVEMVHFLGDADDGEQAKHAPMRMLRNRPEYRFRDRVHEQIGHALPGFLMAERFEHVPVRIDHFGYLGQVRLDRDKTHRNLELLQTQLAEGDDTPFLHFNLGSEYFALAGPAAQAEALKEFRTAYQQVVAEEDFLSNGFLPSLLQRYVRTLRIHAAWDEMDDVCAFIHEHVPRFTDVVYEQALAAIDREAWDQARELLARCQELGDAPAVYSPTVGCGTYLPELRLAAIDVHEGQIDDAIARYAKVRDEHPEFLALIDPYVAALFERGDTPAQVLDELTVGHDLSPSAWFIVGANFQERGALQQAEAAFRGALERRPTFDQARVALADVLLVQGRITDALDAVEGVPVDVRVGGAALRTQLFTRLALEDHDRDAQLAELVQRLPDSNLSEPVQQVLRAWVAQRLGTPLPSLHRAHVEELGLLMDALLRLGAADAFSELIALLAATGLSRREQRQVLATALLVRGLTELAADEWVNSVQEDGPDAAAFAGLAEVARLQGMPDDARTLASEALALEPNHALASRVLDAIAA